MSKGERLRKLRKGIGLSQVEAAEKIGVSKQTLYKYEKDLVTNIPSDIIEKMAKIYESTPAFIFGWSEDVTHVKEQLDPYLKQLSEMAPDPKLVKEAKEIYEEFMNLPPEKRIDVQKYIRFLQSDV